MEAIEAVNGKQRRSAGAGFQSPDTTTSGDSPIVFIIRDRVITYTGIRDTRARCASIDDGDGIQFGCV
jgi:hypothetical protein